jgi:hypothetical protein
LDTATDGEKDAFLRHVCRTSIYRRLGRVATLSRNSKRGAVGCGLALVPAVHLWSTFGLRRAHLPEGVSARTSAESLG